MKIVWGFFFFIDAQILKKLVKKQKLSLLFIQLAILFWFTKCFLVLYSNIYCFKITYFRINVFNEIKKTIFTARKYLKKNGKLKFLNFSKLESE